MPSNQQMYFALVALAAAWGMTLSVIGRYYKEICVKWKNWMSIMVMVSCLFGMINFMVGYTVKHNKYSIIYAAKDGMEAIKCSITNQSMEIDEEHWNKGYVLDGETYEISRELSEDGNRDGVIFYHIAEDMQDSLFFSQKLVSSFSGKYITTDEDKFEHIVNGEWEQIKELKNEGIDYLLLDFYSLENAIEIPEDIATLVYSGERMKIYYLF